MLQDFGGLNCLKIANAKLPDFIGLMTIDTESEFEGRTPLSNSLSTVKKMKWGIPVAVIGKLFMDKTDGLNIKMKDMVVIADSLNSLRVKIRSDNTLTWLLLAGSATTVILGTVAISDQIVSGIRGFFHKIMKYSQKRRNQADWQIFEEEQLCTVCFEHSREIMFNPCKHFLMCRICFEHSARTNCMMCRRPIATITTITQIPNLPEQPREALGVANPQVQGDIFN